MAVIYEGKSFMEQARSFWPETVWYVLLKSQKIKFIDYYELDSNSTKS